MFQRIGMVPEFCEVFEDNRKLCDLASDTFAVHGFTGDTPPFQNFCFFLLGAFVQNGMWNHGVVAGERAKGFLGGSCLFRVVCPTADFPFGSGFIV